MAKSEHKALRLERRHEKLAPPAVFAKRLFASLVGALGLVAIALAIGISGYQHFGRLGWIDSLLEASMILGGMGAIHPITSDAAKIFASAYALFSGLVFIALVGVVLAPVVHRLLHKFHVD